MGHADATDAAESPADAEPESADAEICVAESCPGRTVFSEEGNPEGWIGTDLTVEVWR